MLEHENVWMTQAALAELYQTSTQNITMHIKHIYEEGELEEVSTCKSDLQVGLRDGISCNLGYGDFPISIN